jgi:hypothetical protein
MSHSQKQKMWFGLLPVLALVAAACGDAGAGSGGSDSFQISSPEDGAQVGSPFTVTVDAGVALDDPSTGEHHVHLCFDGADCDAEYQLVYGDTFEVADLPPGEHTIEASLRNADHSDAGATDEITVTVGEGGGDAEGDTGTDKDDEGGYGY